ncbi:50S ribosomal protein L29 [wastewater metagenome]|uniref:Large ribosomal subunit protein uL29 n=2 Tax=unclassified sequences TaxID=12908 RepID=A0A5B8RA47_9ZZZZ|nr:MULTISPECIES: 50S ribosomal protein L29 [Arhodomonas]MCS4504085.1 50S ribosomal protein L29 [Arhodomonas aquaeolei]QEA04262.1 50S ribosomal protein L29 [uncultured organism]
MKVSELRDKDASALQQELLERRKEQFNLRMQQASGQLGRPDQLGKVRRDIARIKTVINEKQRSSEAS